MSRRRPSALRLAGFEPDAVYRKMLALVERHDLCSAVPYEAEQTRDVAAVQQAARDKSMRYKLPFHGGDKMAYARSAMQLEHPSAAAPDDLPADLKVAIAFVVRREGGIIEWRRRRVEMLTYVARELQPLTAHMRSTLSEAAKIVVGKYHLALFAVLIDGTRHVDVFFVRRLMCGFPGYGYMPCTGVYPQGGKPPAQPQEAILDVGHREWNLYLESSVRRRGESSSAAPVQSDTATGARAAYDATVKECAEGWCIGADPQ